MHEANLCYMGCFTIAQLAATNGGFKADSHIALGLRAMLFGVAYFIARAALMVWAVGCPARLM